MSVRVHEDLWHGKEATQDYAVECHKCGRWGRLRLVEGRFQCRDEAICATPFAMSRSHRREVQRH